MTVTTRSVPGFAATARKTAAGAIYRGRFTCPEVQWTGFGKEAIATFTATAEEIADAAENRILWTDQDVQRGIQPGMPILPPRELTLADGYPDSSLYVFDARNADDITDKLLSGEQLFLNPLVWNLRPGHFDAYWDAKHKSIYIYNGRVYLPDSHHRHQAILKAVRLWRESPTSFPKFTGEKQFKVELYFLDREDEGNYFFDKNQRPKPTAKSKAYDLTTQDDLSLLAKRVIEKSNSLKNNVNRVTDRLTSRNPQVVTLSTLREMMRGFAPDEALDDSELEGLATVAAQFYDLFSVVRPELANLTVPERRLVRAHLIVDAAVMMHGYAALMRDFNDDLARRGVKQATNTWMKQMARFSSSNRYSIGKWTGDFFAKANPLWQRVGVVKPGRDGKKLTVLNTGAARGECARVLRQFVSVQHPPKSLEFLARR